ncbi:hypothetical protein BMR10_15840 [Methylococcaceae bacterium CS4]|nr:hypothetical protein BMR10_15840 [Methylococcaceae bacterium CS4]
MRQNQGVDFSKLQDRVATSFLQLSITRGTKKAVRIKQGEPEGAHTRRNTKQLQKINQNK